jgi:hypothetical protein
MRLLMDHVRKIASSEIRDDPTSHVRGRIKERVGLDLRPEEIVKLVQLGEVKEETQTHRDVLVKDRQIGILRFPCVNYIKTVITPDMVCRLNKRRGDQTRPA